MSNTCRLSGATVHGVLVFLTRKMPHCAPLERGNLDMSRSINIENLYRTHYPFA